MKCVWDVFNTQKDPFGSFKYFLNIYIQIGYVCVIFYENIDLNTELRIWLAARFWKFSLLQCEKQLISLLKIKKWTFSRTFRQVVTFELKSYLWECFLIHYFVRKRELLKLNMIYMQPRCIKFIDYCVLWFKNEVYWARFQMLEPIKLM